MSAPARSSGANAAGGNREDGGQSGVLLLALALSLGPAVSLGLARFAYALVLPAMRDDFGWSYALAGGMNAANAAGYLAGALLAAPASALLGMRRAFVGSLLATALALAFSGLASAYPALLALRFVAGVGGAASFVAGGVLAANLASRRREDPTGGGSGRVGSVPVLGIYYGGGGLGIFASAVALPAILEFDPGIAWRWAWVVLGAASLLALLAAGVAAFRLPEPPARPTGEEGRWSARPLLPSFVAYFLFACGYIAYMTFVVAFLGERGAGAFEVSVFWAVLGLAAFASGPAWGSALGRASGGRTFAVVLAVVAAGAILPLAFGGTAAALASAALFGSSFLMTATATTALARKFLPQHAWSAGIAAFTVVFAVGQCVGPVASGIVSDGSGGLGAGLVVSAAVLVCAALTASLQREAPKEAAAAPTPRG